MYGNRSAVLAYTNNGRQIYVKCRPMQWALNHVPGECTFESWIRLQDKVAIVSNRLINLRTDTTEQFTGRHQELPAVYAIGKLHRLFTYTGLSPFTGDALTEIVNSGPPWAYWHATESWAALVDNSDWGMAVLNPGAHLFVGGPDAVGVRPAPPRNHPCPARYV